MQPVSFLLLLAAGPVCDTAAAQTTTTFFFDGPTEAQVGQTIQFGLFAEFSSPDAGITEILSEFDGRVQASGVEAALSFDSAGSDFDVARAPIFAAGSSDPSVDLNGDGSIDRRDYDDLVLEIAAGTNDPAFDVDGDNTVSLADYTQWIDLFHDATGTQIVEGGLFAGGIDAPTGSIVQLGTLSVMVGATDGFIGLDLVGSAVLLQPFAGVESRETLNVEVAPLTINNWVTVGNPGNAPDPTTGFGAVGYAYRIGATEVTNSQYAAFLNAVAASDPNGLYNENMVSDPRGGIIRSGMDGSYTYAVKPNMGDKPVNYVSWYDAARFCNWWTNGRGAGDTESGVYTFVGPNSISAVTRDISNPNQVFIPTDDEWYKAAYHQPFAQGGDMDDYWIYATRSDTMPTIATATTTGDVANPGQDVVNYRFGADWNGQNGNVTTVGSPGNTSFYGAFDMNGNVWEWSETPVGSSRRLRGGSYSNTEFNLQSSNPVSQDPADELGSVGFRVASPPPCFADFNGDGGVDAVDMLDFVAAVEDGDPAADLDGSAAVDFFDVVDFLRLVDAGCS